MSDEQMCLKCGENTCDCYPKVVGLSENYPTHDPDRRCDECGLVECACGYKGELAFVEAENETGTVREMPKYVCHKEVWGLQIKELKLDTDLAQAENRETDGSAMITPEEDGYAPFRVDQEYLRKHQPKVGGYYVLYEGGYLSFSPAKAFEDGYSLIPR